MKYHGGPLRDVGAHVLDRRVLGLDGRPRDDRGTRPHGVRRVCERAPDHDLDVRGRVQRGGVPVPDAHGRHLFAHVQRAHAHAFCRRLRLVVDDGRLRSTQPYDGSVHEWVDGMIDIYYHDLRKWAVDNYEYIEEAMDEGLCEGVTDFHKLIQCGQYVYYRQECQEYLEKIAKIMTEVLEIEGFHAED